MTEITVTWKRTLRDFCFYSFHIKFYMKYLSKLMGLHETRNKRQKKKLILVFKRVRKIFLWGTIQQFKTKHEMWKSLGSFIRKAIFDYRFEICVCGCCVSFHTVKSFARRLKQPLGKLLNYLIITRILSTNDMLVYLQAHGHPHWQEEEWIWGKEQQSPLC